MSNVVHLESQKTDWHHDLDEYERHLQDLQSFSFVDSTKITDEGIIKLKKHLLWLVSRIAENSNLPSDIRIRACKIMWIHAPVRSFLKNVMRQLHDADCHCEMCDEIGLTGPLTQLLAHAK